MLIMSELTIEEHEEWRELANMMQNVAAPPEAFFQTIHAECHGSTRGFLPDGKR